MNTCEKCGKECKTPQALGAHLTLYHRVSKADLEAVNASACPTCGKLVGWDSLPIETRHNNPYYPLPFRLDGRPPIVKGKKCPVCGYFA